MDPSSAYGQGERRRHEDGGLSGRIWEDVGNGFRNTGKADKHLGWEFVYATGSGRSGNLFRKAETICGELRPGYGVMTEHKIGLPYNKGKESIMNLDRLCSYLRGPKNWV